MMMIMIMIIIIIITPLNALPATTSNFPILLPFILYFWFHSRITSFHYLAFVFLVDSFFFLSFHSVSYHRCVGASRAAGVGGFTGVAWIRVTKTIT